MDYCEKHKQWYRSWCIYCGHPHIHQTKNGPVVDTCSCDMLRTHSTRCDRCFKKI